MTGLPPRVHPLVRSFLAEQAGPACSRGGGRR